MTDAPKEGWQAPWWLAAIGVVPVMYIADLAWGGHSVKLGLGFLPLTAPWYLVAGVAFAIILAVILGNIYVASSRTGADQPGWKWILVPNGQDSDPGLGWWIGVRTPGCYNRFPSRAYCLSSMLIQTSNSRPWLPEGCSSSGPCWWAISFR